MAGRALGGLCGCLGLTFVFSFLFSFSQLSPTEVALKYNFVRQTVTEEPVHAPGLYFLGPFTKFIRFPTTVQTMKVPSEGMLRCRTSDGLPLNLAITFQWRLKKESVYHLYRAYDVNYPKVFYLKGTSIINQNATNYTAYNFFNERQFVASSMETELKYHFSQELFADALSVQINGDLLPQVFQDWVTLGQITKNMITQAENVKHQKKVMYDTTVIVAKKKAQVTVWHATGEAAAVTQEAQADAEIIEYYTSAETESYSNLSKQLHLDTKSLLNYVWYDSLGGGGVGAQSDASAPTILVGVAPSAYINGKGPP